MSDDEQVGPVALRGLHERVLGTAHGHLADRDHAALDGRRDGRLELGRARLVVAERPFGVVPGEDGDHVEHAKLGPRPDRDALAYATVRADASEPSTPHAMRAGTPARRSEPTRTEPLASRTTCAATCPIRSESPIRPASGPTQIRSAPSCPASATSVAPGSPDRIPVSARTPSSAEIAEER